METLLQNGMSEILNALYREHSARQRMSRRGPADQNLPAIPSMPAGISSIFRFHMHFCLKIRGVFQPGRANSSSGMT